MHKFPGRDAFVSGMNPIVGKDKNKQIFQIKHMKLPAVNKGAVTIVAHS